MKLWHISDHHGNTSLLVPPSNDFDTVVVTGDMFPNVTRGVISVEVKFQTEWFAERVNMFRNVFNNKPVIWVCGNHDYINPAIFMPEINIIQRGKVVELDGVSFAGFREIPYIAGEWNGETTEDKLADIVQWCLNTGADILVTHTPPYGIGSHYGSRALANGLSYRPHNFRAHLYGHDHEFAGTSQEQLGMMFYNGACSSLIVEV